MVKHKATSINLIPESHRLPPAVSIDHLLIAAVALVLCLGTTILYVNHRRITNLEVRLLDIKTEQSGYDQQIAALKTKLNADAAKSEQQSLVQQIIGKKLPWADIFKELTVVIPQQTWLTELDAKNNAGQVAVYIKGETSSQANMANFYSALERSEFFNQVLMISSKLSDNFNPPLFQFEFASQGMARNPKPAVGP